ncbi:hypothetical protein GQ43DRAFT_216034 [Delitschia confertaspora ATCC 74209]|uniref:Uncharacterized protein n=1 Tax=Delitschia confertaspora ATCC 74209 TaxID=1513339 RepID=A0A9P4JFC8_9PLEO|nr:hypothetical protein GQ43DRAFT_216034 [Delitschia confertaspora ATCC 74209]
MHSANMKKEPDDQYLPLGADETVYEEFPAQRSYQSAADIAPLPISYNRTGTVVLLISILLNVLLIIYTCTHQVSCESDLGKSLYSQNTFDTLIPYHSFTEYWDPNVNQSVADDAWDALDTNPVAVALSDKFVSQKGLSDSTRFPWDTERSVYYIKAYHDLHCLKLIRKAIINPSNLSEQRINLDHVFHCLDGLRQDIMCTADDTPMPAASPGVVGDGQLRLCRDWDKMVAWATRPDNHACHKFDDYREAINTLELFAFCPHDSPYYSTMKSYFEIHGHKQMYDS